MPALASVFRKSAFLAITAIIVSVVCANPAIAQSRSVLEFYNNANIRANGQNLITGPIVNSMNNQIINAMGVQTDSNVWTGANSFSGLTTFTNLVEIDPPSPAWGTDYGAYNGVTSNLNDFPVTQIFTDGVTGSTPIASALTGALLVPSNDVSAFLNNAVSGYVANESGGPGVALFGGAVQLNGSYSAKSWGINTVVGNAAVIASPGSMGFDFIEFYGAEFDINVWKKAGGIRPAGTVRGMSIFSGSEILPTGGAYGVEIGPFELAGSEGWTAGLVIDGAPSTLGIEIGSKARSGSSLGSQAIGFDSVNSSGAVSQSSIFADINGDLVFFAPTTNGSIFQDAGVNEMWVRPGQVFQYSSNGSFLTTYATDSSGNTVIRSGAVGAAISFQDSAATVLAEIGNPSPGTATKTVVADSAGHWFSQAGFTGSKTAGSCALTVVAGAITNITGC